MSETGKKFTHIYWQNPPLFKLNGRSITKNIFNTGFTKYKCHVAKEMGYSINNKYNMFYRKSKFLLKTIRQYFLNIVIKYLHGWFM